MIEIVICVIQNFCVFLVVHVAVFLLVTKLLEMRNERCVVAWKEENRGG